MTTEQRRWALVTFRLQQAEESLAEARCLQAGGMSSRSVINRAYYAMFYSVLALLVYEPYSSSKHSGVLGYFNQRFVRTGEVEERFGRALNKAFELRQRSDYRRSSRGLTLVRHELRLTRARLIDTARLYLASALQTLSAIRRRSRPATLADAIRESRICQEFPLAGWSMKRRKEEALDQLSS